MNSTIPAIQTDDLYKSYDKLDVLRGINLKIFPGEVVCILGPSGSGKSTLLRCLNWLSPPTRGKVWISGQLLGVKETPKGDFISQSDAELRAMRSQIGMVFQGFNLWSHRTALENIMEGPLIVRKFNKKVAKELALYFLEQVGLADKWNIYPSKLSGGQQQRVAIARALAMEPKILLFDEPTSALDPELVGEVLSVMRDLALKHTTMLVVTHEIGFAAEAADRIVFMDQGKIVEENTPREFIHNPRKARSQQFLNQFLSRNPFSYVANV